MTEFLVTGTGRCGTGSAWQALRDYGLDVTHQGIRHEHALVDGFGRSVGVDGDVSFEAAPLARLLAEGGWRVVLLHRDPAKVIRSWLSLGAFTDAMASTHEMWWRSLQKHTPQVLFPPTPVQRATQFYIEWNRLVLPHADVVLRLDHTDRVDLINACIDGDLVNEFDVDENALPRADFGTPQADRVERPSINTSTVRRIRAEVRDRLGEQFSYRLEET